jgi:hypothetical protein
MAWPAERQLAPSAPIDEDAGMATPTLLGNGANLLYEILILVLKGPKIGELVG